MNNVFIIKLLFSFIIGGLWAIMASVIADKLGSKIGGLIAGLPSTALFGLFFIAWTQSAQTAVQATTIIPAAFVVTAMFLTTYVFFLKNNIWFSLVVSFIVWFVASSILVLTKLNNLYLSLFAYIILLSIMYFLLEKVLKIESIKGKKINYTPSIILFRGLLSGIIVSFVVLFAKLGGPTIGGILSAFPALFTSTIIIVYFSQGASFSKAFTKSAMIGTISIVAYAMAVRFTYTSVGIIYGTIISIFISLITSYLTYELLVKKTI